MFTIKICLIFLFYFTMLIFNYLLDDELNTQEVKRENTYLEIKNAALLLLILLTIMIIILGGILLR